MRISRHGRNEEGSILLRSVITVFLSLICFSAIFFGFSVVMHSGGDVLRNAQNEIQKRNLDVQTELR